MKALTSRQAIILVLVTIIATKFFILPINLAEGMKQNLLFIMPIFLSFEILLIIGLFKLSIKYEKLSFYEILEKSFGTIYAKIFFILLFALFLGKNIININETYGFFLNTLYEELSPLLYIIPFAILFFYSFIKGLNAIGRTVEILWKLILFGILSALIIGISNMDITNLLPLFNEPITDSLTSLQENIFWFGDYFIFLILFGDIRYEKKFIKNLSFALIICFILVLIFFIVYYCLFPYSSGLHHFAVSEVTQFAPTVSNFGRLDWITSFIWVMGSIIQSVIYYYCSTKCLKYIFNSKSHITFNIISLSILLLGVYLLHLNLETTITLAQGPIRFTIPLLIILTVVCAPIQQKILERKNVYEKQKYPNID